MQAFLVLFVILNLAFFQALWGHRTLMSSAFGVPSIIASGAYGTARFPPPKAMRTLDPGAPAWQFEPAMAFNHNEVFKRHHLPLWNPYAAYGVPWAANMLSQPFYPLSFLVSLHPSPRMISWFLILRLLSAGFFAYLYLRYFVPQGAALTGGIAFMLTGYFMLFINADHLSTETLIPIVFYATERLLRDGSVKSKLVAAAAVYLTIVSGMPESTLLILAYVPVYFVYRLASEAKFRAHLFTGFSNFVASNVLGVGLASFLLLPFYEFLRNGLDSHRPSITHFYWGLIYEHVPLKELLLWLCPMAMGNLWFRFPRWSGHLWGYFGITVVTLAILALISAARAHRRFWTDSQAPLVLFFFGSVVVFFLKFSGNPLVNWAGALPLFRLINFPKYIQPLLGFAMAMLAALGVSYVFERRARFLDIFAAPLASLFAIAICALSFRRELATHPPNAHMFYVSLYEAVAVLLSLTTAMQFYLTCARRTRTRWCEAVGRWAVIGVITLELTCNFIAPMFYHFTYMPPNRANPYKGAPYIQFLQRRTGDYFRVFARNFNLYPNWSSAFGLYDERYLYAVNWNKMFFFIRSFLGPENYAPNGELGDRFTGGSAPYTFASWKEQRFLQLSSTRYLIGFDGYIGELSSEITAVLEQNKQRIAKDKLHVSRTGFNIAGQGRDVLFAHPPTKRLQWVIVVPRSKTILVFSPAIDPAVWDTRCGDGVEFTVELLDESGSIRTLYDRYIDPKHNLTERRWLDERLNLSRYRGKQVTLLFSTSGGPRGDTACDWAGWAGLRFTTAAPDLTATPASDIRKIYNNEVVISEYQQPLPRASIFYSVELASSDNNALEQLQDPKLDVWRRVVLVSPESRDQTLKGILHELATTPGVPAQPASIVSYDSQRVVIQATLNRSGIVMLTDSNYPGWNAYLDGRRVPILSANYLFRGVLTPAGSHTIEFRYEPKSYFYGGFVSLFSLLLLTGWTLGSGKRARAYLSSIKGNKGSVNTCVFQ